MCPDSTLPCTLGEDGRERVPLTDIAVEAFRNQIDLAGSGPWLFPSPKPGGVSDGLRENMGADPAEGGNSILSPLRLPLDARDPIERGRRRGRVGHATAAADRRQGVQEVLTNETADETL
jgi:hypothetical protein